MKFYLGNKTDCFCAICLLLLIIVALSLSIFVGVSGRNFETAITSIGYGVCGMFFCLYLRNFSSHLFSFGCLTQKGMDVFSLFKKKTHINYDKCNDIGIAYYVHGLLGSGIGHKQYYIFLSYKTLSYETKTNINKTKPTDEFVKFKFSNKIYNYMLNVLPPKQKKMLEQSFKEQKMKSF